MIATAPASPASPVTPDALSSLRLGDPLPAATFAAVRRHVIFDCCKWDPQVEDVSTLTPFPLLLPAAEWARLREWARQMHQEVIAAEQELLRRPELFRRLAMPWGARRRLRSAARLGAPAGAARIMRFDFHPTTDGWRISEVNCDVPGGFIEASGFTNAVAAHVAGAVSAGNTAAVFARAVLHNLRPGAIIALVHATAYTDDRQAMIYLSRQIEAAGGSAVLVAPDQLRWRDGFASVHSDWYTGPVDALVRFFPGEWLSGLPWRCASGHWFAGGRTPMSNPATALLLQSKRIGCLLARGEVSMPTFSSLLPETRDPRQVDPQRSEAWVLKPALGRVGEAIRLLGVTEAREAAKIARHARRWPGEWVAQRRFDPTALRGPDGFEHFSCLGVFTIDGKAAGIYGRLARRPLIDYKAQDVAVLVTGS